VLGLKSKVTSRNPMRVKIMSTSNHLWTSVSIHSGMFVQSFHYTPVWNQPIADAVIADKVGVLNAQIASYFSTTHLKGDNMKLLKGGHINI